jgi:hypothetical protein
MIKKYQVTYKPGSKYSKTPMIRLANQLYLTGIAGLNVGDKLSINYLPGEIRIVKINNNPNLCSEKS